MFTDPSTEETSPFVRTSSSIGDGHTREFVDQRDTRLADEFKLLARTLEHIDETVGIARLNRVECISERHFVVRTHSVGIEHRSVAIAKDEGVTGTELGR